MAFVIGFLLTLLSILILIYPFLRSRARESGASHGKGPEELALERRDLLNDMERLKLDLEAQDITAVEFQQRTAVLRRRAALAMRAEEEARAKVKRSETCTLESLDKDIEERIMRLRRPAPVKKAAALCPECGQPPEALDESCSHCGAALPRVKSYQCTEPQ